VNRRVGARTQLAELVAAAATLVTMLLAGAFIGLMPEATLAAVVICVFDRLDRPAEFRAILEVRANGVRVGLVALVGVVLLGTLQGIVVAIVVSLVALATRSPTRRSMCWGASLAPTSPTSFRGPSRGRNVPRVAPAAAGGPDFLRPMRKHVGWKMRSLAVDAKRRSWRWISAVCTISSTRRSGC